MHIGQSFNQKTITLICQRPENVGWKMVLDQYEYLIDQDRVPLLKTSVSFLMNIVLIHNFMKGSLYNIYSERERNELD